MGERRWLVPSAVARDGNCFYRALVRSAASAGAWPSERRLRALHAPLAAHPRAAAAFERALRGDEAATIRWLRILSLHTIVERGLLPFFPGGARACARETLRDGRFADHVQIQALATALSLDIHVLRAPDGRERYAAVRALGPAARRARRVFVLFSPEAEHYDALLTAPPPPP